MQFMAVASIPMWSARVRSMLPSPSLTPRQKLPPPMTIPTCTPMSTHCLITSHTRPMTSKVQTEVLVAGQRLAADLQQHPLECS